MTSDTGETNCMKPSLNRREFLAQATATATLAVTASTAMAGMVRSKNSLPKSPTEKVTLGKSGVQVSLMGTGIGSVGSGQASNQTRLGVKEFTKVVRHAIDQEICFFDEVASVLEEMHNAGKGIMGMKVLGEGRITTPERKDASPRYVLGLGTVNAFIIGFESTEQVDDLLKRTADALTFLKA
jgi:hypothetical protein